MDEIWEEIDIAEADGARSIEVAAYRLDVGDRQELERAGYSVDYRCLGDAFEYYIISWELV